MACISHLKDRDRQCIAKTDSAVLPNSVKHWVERRPLEVAAAGGGVTVYAGVMSGRHHVDHFSLFWM